MTAKALRTRFVSEFPEKFWDDSAEASRRPLKLSVTRPFCSWVVPKHGLEAICSQRQERHHQPARKLRVQRFAICNSSIASLRSNPFFPAILNRRRASRNSLSTGGCGSRRPGNCSAAKLQPTFSNRRSASSGSLRSAFSNYAPLNSEAKRGSPCLWQWPGRASSRIALGVMRSTALACNIERNAASTPQWSIELGHHQHTTGKPKLIHRLYYRKRTPRVTRRQFACFLRS